MQKIEEFKYAAKKRQDQSKFLEELLEECQLQGEEKSMAKLITMTKQASKMEKKSQGGAVVAA